MAGDGGGEGAPRADGLRFANCYFMGNAVVHGQNMIAEAWEGGPYTQLRSVEMLGNTFECPGGRGDVWALDKIAGKCPTCPYRDRPHRWYSALTGAMLNQQHPKAEAVPSPETITDPVAS